MIMSFHSIFMALIVVENKKLGKSNRRIAIIKKQQNRLQQKYLQRKEKKKIEKFNSVFIVTEIYYEAINLNDGYSLVFVFIGKLWPYGLHQSSFWRLENGKI